MHLGILLAPMTFSWQMVQLFFVSYFVTGCLGITLGYHRLLAHKSFTAPKVGRLGLFFHQSCGAGRQTWLFRQWLEYTVAYFANLAGQGDPIDW